MRGVGGGGVTRWTMQGGGVGLGPNVQNQAIMAWVWAGFGLQGGHVGSCGLTTPCYGYIDFSLTSSLFLLLPFPSSFYHLLIPLKSKSPFYISAIHFPESWTLFY